ncbi:MAG: HD domain-containing protein [Flavobacteriales bacterium]|nr:HD domain-containing protein [Flavobacteriales bacterium]
MNYQAAHLYVTSRMKEELSSNLIYHGLHHTLDVIDSIAIIAKKEGLTDQETTIAKTAALYHDIGFIFEYEDNEMLAIDLASETLPKFDYTLSEIKIITRMIEATIIHVEPNTLLEKMMVDADFDYFGRSDFEQIATTLHKELQIYNNVYTADQWDEVQLQFLKTHRYYTNYSIKNRLPKKKKNVEKIVDRQAKRFE